MQTLKPSIRLQSWLQVQLKFLGTVGVAVACGTGGEARTAASAPLDCGVGTQEVLTDSGVGALRVGVPVASVRLLCTVLNDTTIAHGAEGQPERRLTVVLGSVNTTATIVADRVWRIEIISPRFQTRDSLGVGSAVADLRGPGATLALGEGTYVLRPDHCGLSFQLASPVGAATRLEQVPDSTRVRRVLVTECRT